MAKDNLNLGESFSAKVVGGNVETKPRHYWIGWALIAAMMGGGGYWAFHDGSKPGVFQERPGLHESLGTKIGGILTVDVIRASGLVERIGVFKNTVVNEGENMLEDCFEGNTGSACTNVALWKYHGLGTSSQVIAETDGGCITELTTQYTGDVRATGSQTNNGANIYRTVATNTIDSGGPVSIEEFCLMDTASGAGDVWTRILTGTITLQTNDALQTTYDLTIE